MKTILFAALLVGFSASAFAQSNDVLLRERCTLSDLADSQTPTTFNQVFDMKAGDKISLTDYQGVHYDIALFDLTQPSDSKPRREFMIGARDIAAKTLIGSLVTTYSFENPEVVYQVGENVLVRCSPED